MWWKKKEKKEVVLVVGNENPLKELDKKCKEYKTFFDQWVIKQSIPVEASVATVAGAVPGAAFGVCLTTLVDHVLPAFNLPPRPATSQTNIPGCPPSLVPYQPLISGGTLAQARNFAVLMSVNAGISCVMKRLRGKKDFETCMMAGFGSGVMSSLVSGMRGPSVIPVGVFFALLNGGAFKVKERRFSQQEIDAKYKKIRRMLSNLGLTQYENNFKKAMLDDRTFLLLTERYKIRVNSIAPGIFKSEITEKLFQKKWIKNVASKTVPLRDFGTTDPALTSLVRYLIHDSSSYVTGNIFIADGGYSLPGVPLYSSL